jgi:hypothetical protein
MFRDGSLETRALSIAALSRLAQAKQVRGIVVELSFGLRSIPTRASKICRNKTFLAPVAQSPLKMVPHMLPYAVVEVREYLDHWGYSPFAAWSDRLNREAAAKVAAALARMQQGNFSNAKGVGAGVYEYGISGW